MSPNNNSTETPRKKKAGKGLVKKAAFCAVLGLTFGVCSGSGVWAVQQFTGNSGSQLAATTEAQSSGTGTTATAAIADANTQQKVTTTSSTNTQTVTTDVTQVVQNVMPSIVAINNNYTETVQSMFGQSGEESATASGSGIIVGKSDTELLIATNNHVVENADTLQVEFNDGTKASADIKGTDSSKDLAVVAVKLSDLSSDTLSKIAVATLGDSDSLTVGEPAIAIGNALGYGQSVTTGVISALNRKIELEDGSTGTFIQTDAAINPGNSGGALINSKGEVIGINSNKIGGETVEGMGYAIPISDAEPIIDKLMNETTKTKASTDNRGALGVSVMTPTGVEGAYVAAVEDGSAAADAGIEEGDLITKLNDTEISSRDDLSNALEYYTAGTKVTVTVLRRGDSGYETKELTVTLQKAATTSDSTDSSAQSGNGTQSGSGTQSGNNSQADFAMPFAGN
jgi:serine protease Do